MVTRAVIGIIGLVMLAATLAVRATGRELRVPTDDDRRTIAEPLGRIALRHADLSRLGPDLIDAVDAGTAAAAYITAGPLTTPPVIVDAGVPTNLQPESEPPL